MGWLVSNKNKRKGFFCKRSREWKGSLKNRGKGRGVLANVPSFFLLTRKTEEWAMGHRRPWARGPGGMAAAGDSGKGVRRRRDSIPLLDLGGGGL